MNHHVNGTAANDSEAAPEPKPEIKAGDTIVLDEPTQQNLQNCGLAAEESLLEIMSMMPRGAEHMPLFVVSKVIARLTGAYFTGVAPKVMADMRAEADVELGRFTLMQQATIEQWKRGVLERVAKNRADRGEVPELYLPPGARRKL